MSQQSKRKLPPPNWKRMESNLTKLLEIGNLPQDQQRQAISKMLREMEAEKRGK